MTIKRMPNGEEHEIDDETGLCVRVRVPVMLMDGGDPVQQQVAADDDRARAYEEMVERTSNAWQKPASSPEVQHVAQPPADAEAAYAEYVARLQNAWQGVS